MTGYLPKAEIDLEMKICVIAIDIFLIDSMYFKNSMKLLKRILLSVHIKLISNQLQSIKFYKFLWLIEAHSLVSCEYITNFWSVVIEWEIKRLLFRTKIENSFNVAEYSQAMMLDKHS